MGNRLVNTSNSRTVYNSEYYRIKNVNADQNDPAFYGLTKEQFDTWYQRATKIANGEEVEYSDIKIIFKGTGVIW